MTLSPIVFVCFPLPPPITCTDMTELDPANGGPLAGIRLFWAVFGVTFAVIIIVAWRTRVCQLVM